jgi:hypothetical protein
MTQQRIPEDLNSQQHCCGENQVSHARCLLTHIQVTDAGRCCEKKYVTQTAKWARVPLARATGLIP